MQVLASLGCQIAAFLTHIIFMNMINILFQFILIISKNLINPLFSIRLQVSLQMQFLNLGIFTSFFILIFQYIVTHNKILGVLQFFIVVEQLLKQNSMINLTSKQLQEYTKDQNHHGINKMDILLKFIEYIGQCQDPQNIFRFMEEKAICTFLSQYWLFKADYYVQIGQFRMAFQYLQQAQSRNGIGQDDKEKFVDINSKYKKIFNVLVNDIKNFPLKSKRSIEEYDLISNEKKNSNQKQKKQKLLQLYQNKYSGLKKQKQQASQLKRKHFGKSWLYEIYEKQDSKELKIEEMVMENSNRLSKDYRNHTMHTPIRYRDPQRLTKTMDSVEILKKKKSTNEKSRKNGKINKDHDVSDSELLDEDWNIQDSSSKMITSVPVGRKFTQLKQRRVTFDMSGKSLMLQQKQKRQNSLSFCDKSASNSILSKNNLLQNKKKKIETSEIKDKQTLSQVSQNPKSSKGVKFQPKK